MFKSLWKPLHLSFDPDQRVEQLFNELIHQPWGHCPPKSAWQPTINVVETDTAYILEADLPGVLPENVDLRILDNVLVLRGRRESVEVSRTAHSLCVERAHAEFTREFKLFQPINPAAVQTRFENGILRAVVPKRRAEE
ncbi:MAG: Hsp20/alpha crystallin family protein [Planctomycetes bacterium]|nr:Hsp20/alpha crystallin family protein [Planctomycetota bacterium]